MARSIPTYQRQVIADGIQSAPTASGNISANDPMASALGSLGQAVGQFEEKQRKMAEDRAAVDVANVLSQGEVYWQEDFSKRTKAWAPGSPDMRDGIGQDFDKWVSEASQKLPTQASQNYFRQHAIAMKTRMQTGAFSFQEKVIADKLTIDTGLGIEDDKKVVFADPSRFDDLLRRRGETILARNDLSPAEKTKQVNEFKSALALARETGDLTKDPAGWLKRNYGDGGGPAAPGAPGEVDFSILEPRQAKRLASVKLTPVHTQAIDGAAGGDTQKAAWLRAVVTIENRGNPEPSDKAVSKAGAVGSFQFMSATGQQYGLKDADRTDFGKSAAAAGKFYDDLFRMYRGNQAAMLAHYNGGGRAAQAVMAGKEPPAQETRDYVKMGQALGIGGAAPAGPAGVQVASAGAATASDAGNGMPAMRSRTLEALDLQQQIQLKAMAETRMRQDDARTLANLSIEAAQQAVSGQDIGTSAEIDLQRATGQAIATAEQRLGRPLDAAQQQQIEGAVSHAAGVRERDRKRAQENTASSMFDLLDQNGGDYQDLQRKMVREMDDLPREAVDRLQEYAGKVATGQTRATDWQAYTQLIESPELLAQANLMAIRDKFSAQEFNQLVKLQDSAKKAAESGSDQTIQSDMAVVKSLLDDAGVGSKDKQAQFFSVLQREMDVARAQSGKKSLKQEEVKAIAADLLVREITRKGVLWDTKERAFEIEVPPADRMKIITALTGAGLPVNDSTILRSYRNKLNRAVQPAAGRSAPAAASVDNPFASPAAQPQRPPSTRPSIYASPEEWAAYREEQKAAQ